MLIGVVHGSPGINKEKQRTRVSLQTMRRMGKIDYTIINLHNRELISVIETLSEDDFVAINGFLASNNVKKSAICELY